MKLPYVEKRSPISNKEANFSQSKIFIFSSTWFVQKECVCGHLSNVMLHKLNCKYYYSSIYI